MHADPALVQTVFLGLFAGHYLGDYLVQTDHQALTKGECGRAGRRACADHVATLTLCQAVAVIAAVAATGQTEQVHPAAAAIGLAVNAATHWWADRRSTLRGLIVAMAPLTDKVGFYDNGGAPHIDQAWHMAWLLPAALAAGAPLGLAAAIGAASAAALAACAIASRRARAREAASASS